MLFLRYVLKGELGDGVGHCFGSFALHNSQNACVADLLLIFLQSLMHLPLELLAC